MEIWGFLASFVLGAGFGSFLNVLVYRSKKEISLLEPSSFCPNCEEKIRWYDNIPILSFLLLGGKCRNCKEEISWQYFLVELWLALVFLFIWRFHGLDSGVIIILRDWFTVFVLTFIFTYDLRYQQILDRVTIPAILIIFFVNAFFGWVGATAMILGAAVAGGFFLLQFVVSRGRWIGGGDIRLGVLMGVILGWPEVLLALFLAYVIGAVISIILLIFKDKSFTSKTPFGVYLSIGTFIALFFYDEILNWYLNLVLF
ncbi:MAG: A24 family peptidase [Candidatus Magasanikbacteria bacterium]